MCSAKANNFPSKFPLSLPDITFSCIEGLTDIDFLILKELIVPERCINRFLVISVKEEDSFDFFMPREYSVYIVFIFVSTAELCIPNIWQIFMRMGSAKWVSLKFI